MQVEEVLGLPADDCIFTSAKTGQGVDELLDAICERFPPPQGSADAKLQALIFDAKYDDYRGVVVYFRIMNGSMKKGDRIRMMGIKRTFHITELGKFRPQMQKVDEPFDAGDVGYMVASIKSLDDVNIGDTITLDTDPADEPLPGYQEPQPMVFCDFYPSGETQFDELREAIAKLHINDASFTFEPTNSEALGSGFPLRVPRHAPHGHHPRTPRTRKQCRARANRADRDLRNPATHQGRRHGCHPHHQPRRPT